MAFSQTMTSTTFARQQSYLMSRRMFSKFKIAKNIRTAVLVHLLGGYHQEVLSQWGNIPFTEDPITRHKDSVKARGDEEGDKKAKQKDVLDVYVLVLQPGVNIVEQEEAEDDEDDAGDE